MYKKCMANNDATIHRLLYLNRGTSLRARDRVVDEDDVDRAMILLLQRYNCIACSTLAMAYCIVDCSGLVVSLFGIWEVDTSYHMNIV